MNETQIQVEVNEQSQQIFSSKSKIVFECRICLEEMQSKEVELPCKCKGFNEFIHESCFLAWSKKTMQKEKGSPNYYQLCDICKDKIILETGTVYHLITCEEVKTNLFGDQIICTIATIIFVLCSILILSIIVALSPNAHDQIENTVITVGIVLCAVICAGALLNFILTQIIRSQRKVIRILPNKSNVQGH